MLEDKLLHCFFYLSTNIYNKIQMKIVKINENLIEEDYPVGFNMDELKSLKTFKQKAEYCAKTLKRLSSGSSRIVYLVDNTKVLKLAKNKKGLAQNRAEADSHIQDYDCFAKVFDSDYDDYWVEMELAKKCSKSDFQQIVGLSLEQVYSAIEYHHSDVAGIKYNKFTTREGKEIFKQYGDENELLFNLTHFIADYHLKGIGDFGTLSSYGIVERNGKPTVVLIDYGLNNRAYDMYFDN